MFGVVPKPLWERRAPADDRNRIRLAMRPLLVRGDADDDHRCRRRRQDGREGRARSTAIDRTPHSGSCLAAAGLSARATSTSSSRRTCTSITPAASRAATAPAGSCRGFPARATSSRAAEWEDATHPHERNRASYLAENFVPLREAGVLDLIDDDGADHAGGAGACGPAATRCITRLCTIESGGLTAVFAADLIPTTAHLDNAWVMGYDLYPMDTLAFKRAFIREAIDREISDILRARSGGGRGLHPRGERPPSRGGGRGRLTHRLSRRSRLTEHVDDDWHHRRQRPVRHGGADRSRRAHASRRRSAIRPGPYVLGTLRGKRVAFLARHGAGHRLLPTGAEFPREHLRLQDARRRVHPLGERRRQPEGGIQAARHRRSPISSSIAPRGAISTFFGDGLVAHVGFAHPFCAPLSDVAFDCGRGASGATVHRGGTYVCMEGPQFSTLAESRLYRSWGMDIIGMTNLQEAKLAREAEICYATHRARHRLRLLAPGPRSVTVEMIIAQPDAEREDGAAGDRGRRRAPAVRAHVRVCQTRSNTRSSRARTRCPTRCDAIWRRSSAATCS